LTGEVGLLEVFRRFRNECFPSITDFYECFISRTVAAASADIRSRITAGFPTNYLGDFQFYTREDRLFRYIRDEVLQPEEYVEIMQDLMRTMNTNAERMSRNLFLDKDWLRALEKDGHVIGLHSHSHPTCMADLPKEKQRLEYETNYKVLSDILIEPPYAVAHPCNSYSADTLRILRELGIRIGFRSNTARLDLSSLEFPRRDCADLLIDLAL
ncbi:MAG TPA: polysaccharide deacetylase family protein, partial [Candidatus Hodarchaeales archaeon]|nr:polysaccharide deacetylase family protein [Candidatus Hodarchaeales archaeon]